MAAAAAFGGWVGQAIVENLVNTASAYLKDQIAWGANINSALSKLKTSLLPIQVALEQAEKVELNLGQNPRLGEWIWELRDAIEEAEDVLDQMEYYRLERQILERDAKEKVLTPTATASTGFKFRLINFFKVHGCCSATSFKYNCVKIGKRALKMDNTLNKLNDAVEKLETVNKGINVLNSVIGNSPSLRGGNTSNSRETGPVLTADVVVGREEDKEKVLNWLTESGCDSQESCNFSAVTIWGVGGVGKTTLAQSVYNDAGLDFQVKMWVCISNNQLSMMEIMKKALESITGSLPSATSLSSLQDDLKNKVTSKKCLVVLDDVWGDQLHQNQQEWEKFIGLLNYAERGSKILITTRDKAVTEVIVQGSCSKKDLALSCLEEDKSFSLFIKYAFAGEDSDKYNHLKPVGRRIVKKCGGLPLALKIVGGLLNTRMEYGYWDSVSKKEILNLHQGPNNVKNVLKFSYQCLPSQLQSCFRVCSLYPQDYEFEADELVTLWMGLGCIKQSNDENAEPEDIGHRYLDILVKRSFFVYDYRDGTYTMHDLLHDLARDVSTGECLRVEGNKSVTLPKTIRHLFVDQLNSDLLEEISSLKRLRTLALNYSYDMNFDPEDFPDYSELYDILKQLVSLHALYVSSKTMPSLSILEQLKHLRLFHLKVSILDQPLTPLCKLSHLQNLKCEEADDANQLIGCDGIGNLVKLRHLVLPSRIFDQITQLRHLIELQEVDLHLKNDNMLKLSDLKDLNKLRHLSITDERETTSFEEAEKANIKKKEHLETLSLSLKWTNHDFKLHEQFCNCLAPQIQSKIKDLRVANYSGVRAPRWMTSDYLPYVTHLELSKWENLEHLPPLGQLPSLKVLSLKKIAGLKRSGIEFFGSDDIGGFPSLEELRIEEMENWEEWTRVDDANWFPCLKEMHIENCHKLKELPALPVCLKILYLESVGLVALPTWHEVSSSHSTAPVLEDLKIQNCQKLMNVQLLLSKCICLEKLYIKDCKSLKELPALPLSLKYLRLESVGLIALPAWHDVNDNEVIPSLDELDIENCEELVYVQPFLRKCVSLKELRISNCPQILYGDESNLNQVTSSICLDLFDGLSSLTTLKLGDFAGIRNLDCLKGLSLKSLRIDGCQNLISLDGLEALKSLDYLSVAKCDHLITSPSAESFYQTHSPSSFHIKTLVIDNILLLQIEPLRSIKSVKELMVSGDVHASWVSHQWLLQNQTSLESLRIWDCPVLESLPDELPSSLTKLWIYNCPQLMSLPESMPSSLKKLEINNCPIKELLPDLGL